MSGAAAPCAHADIRTSLPPHALKFLSMIHLAHVVAAAALAAADTGEGSWMDDG